MAELWKRMNKFRIQQKFNCSILGFKVGLTSISTFYKGELGILVVNRDLETIFAAIVVVSLLGTAQLALEGKIRAHPGKIIRSTWGDHIISDDQGSALQKILIDDRLDVAKVELLLVVNEKEIDFGASGAVLEVVQYDVSLINDNFDLAGESSVFNDLTSDGSVERAHLNGDVDSVVRKLASETNGRISAITSKLDGNLYQESAVSTRVWRKNRSGNEHVDLRK